MIEKYRLKVQTVDAVQLVDMYGDTARDHLRRATNIALWCGGSVKEDEVGKITVVISTPSGNITAERGDYIIFDGTDFLVMKDNEFKLKYDKVITTTKRQIINSLY